MARRAFVCDVVRLEGLEPSTDRLEGDCSVQLSYRRRPGGFTTLPVALVVSGLDMW